MLADEPSHTRRQYELLEGGRLVRDAAKHERDGAALPVPVDAKARAGRRIRDVELTCLEESLASPRRRGADLVDDGGQVGFGEPRLVERLEPPVAANARRAAHLEVKVTRLRIDRSGE